MPKPESFKPSTTDVWLEVDLLKPSKIDEGKDMITGEIDEHGYPIVDKSEECLGCKPPADVDKKNLALRRKRKKKGLCAYCGHDPCTPDCLYR